MGRNQGKEAGDKSYSGCQGRDGDEIKAEAGSGDCYAAVRSYFEPFYYASSPTFAVDESKRNNVPKAWICSRTHDSPGLQIDKGHSSQSTETTSPALAAGNLRCQITSFSGVAHIGSTNAGGPSFAKMLCKQKTQRNYRCA